MLRLSHGSPPKSVGSAYLSPGPHLFLTVLEVEKSDADRFCVCETPHPGSQMTIFFFFFFIMMTIFLQGQGVALLFLL